MLPPLSALLMVMLWLWARSCKAKLCSGVMLGWRLICCVDGVKWGELVRRVVNFVI